MASFFEHAHHTNFSGSQSFNAGIVINNYNHPTLSEESVQGPSSSGNNDQWLTLPGKIQRLRVIDVCDMNTLEEVSINTVRVSVEPPASRSTDPFRDQPESQGGSVKIRKRMQITEIVQFGGRRFTAVSFQPENEEDAERIQTVLRPLYQYALSSRPVWTTQIFGIGRAAMPMLIYHGGLASSRAIVRQHMQIPIVHCYLRYKLLTAINAVEGDETLQKLSVRCLRRSEAWMFNLKTRSFQVDIPLSKMLLSAEDGKDARDKPAQVLAIGHSQLLHPPSCNPLLDAREILSAFPNFIDLALQESATAVSVDNFTNFIRHDLLTFGAVVRHTDPAILCYFPTFSCPIWFCLTDSRSDIVAEYSQSVPSLLHLSFASNDMIEPMRLHIGFRLTLCWDDCRYRSSFILQSRPLFDNATDTCDMVFLDDIFFHLVGNLVSDPSESHPPKYLHVPPLSPEWINGMPCIHRSSLNQLFYWSFDPNGTTRIAEKDWELHGIPKLRLDRYLGSNWGWQSYYAVWECLSIKNYAMDGYEFARQHGYPLLIKGDPHVRVEDPPSLEVRVGKRPKSRFRRTISLIGKALFKWKGSSGGKVKDKGKARELNSLDAVSASVGQTSIVEIPD